MYNDKKFYQTYDLAYFKDDSMDRHTQDFALEEPLSIRVDDEPYSIVMRTPGDEIAHAAGFCFAEGLIDSKNDIASITFCSDDENSITLKLTEKRKDMVSGKIKNGCYLSQTSCGICGREMIDDLIKNLNAINTDTEITYSQINECINKFSGVQELYIRTRGTHAVMLFDRNLNIIGKAEDVGRHNAMDKAIGTLFLTNKLSDVFLAVVSSRLSFEMIQKSARAKIPIIVSMSNPTSMAVDLGSKLNMTLICQNKKAGFIVPCGENRIKASISKNTSIQ